MSNITITLLFFSPLIWLIGAVIFFRVSPSPNGEASGSDILGGLIFLSAFWGLYFLFK